MDEGMRQMAEEDLFNEMFNCPDCRVNEDGGLEICLKHEKKLEGIE